MFKAILILLFVAAVGSLFAGLFFMLRDRGRSTRTVNALALRVLFCALLIAALVLGIFSGQITPHSPFPT